MSIDAPAFIPFLIIVSRLQTPIAVLVRFYQSRSIIAVSCPKIDKCFQKSLVDFDIYPVSNPNSQTAGSWSVGQIREWVCIKQIHWHNDKLGGSRFPRIERQDIFVNQKVSTSDKILQLAQNRRQIDLFLAFDCFQRRQWRIFSHNMQSAKLLTRYFFRFSSWCFGFFSVDQTNAVDLKGSWFLSFLP